MNSHDLLKKYLKYKKKFLSLRESIIQIGSGYFNTFTPGTNHKTYHIMANINNPYLIHQFDDRRSGILYGRPAVSHMGHTFHVSLLTIEINRDSALAHLFEDVVPLPKKPHNKNIRRVIQQMVIDAYDETFRKSIVILAQERGKYNRMGKFYAKKYPIYSDQQRFGDPKTRTPLPTINSFRILFYDKLRKYLGIPSFNWTDSPDGNYKLAIYNGETIFAVPIYDFGPGKWDPHVSIVKEDEIKEHNPALHGKVSSSILTDEQKALEITNVLSELKLSELYSINMNDNIGDIVIA